MYKHTPGWVAWFISSLISHRFVTKQGSIHHVAEGATVEVADQLTGQRYLILVHPIEEAIKEEKPLMYSDIMSNWN